MALGGEEKKNRHVDGKGAVPGNNGLIDKILID